jgi:hypothetical protein
MRKPGSPAASATASLAAARGDETPLMLVCLALGVALLALAFRIACTL